MARPRQFTPQEAARRNKAQKAASAKRRKHHFNDARREKRFRKRQLDPRREGFALVDACRSVVNEQQLRRPNLLWMDHHGNLHTEIWETADELIARITRKERACPNKHQTKNGS